MQTGAAGGPERYPSRCEAGARGELDRRPSPSQSQADGFAAVAGGNVVVGDVVVVVGAVVVVVRLGVVHGCWCRWWEV